MRRRNALRYRGEVFEDRKRADEAVSERLGPGSARIQLVSRCGTRKGSSRKPRPMRKGRMPALGPWQLP